MALYRSWRMMVEGEKLVGMLAQADVAAGAGDKETGRMVEQISE